MCQHNIKILRAQALEIGFKISRKKPKAAEVTPRISLREPTALPQIPWLAGGAPYPSAHCLDSRDYGAHSEPPLSQNSVPLISNLQKRHAYLNSTMHHIAYKSIVYGRRCKQSLHCHDIVSRWSN
jgi:hypothetical protein